MRAREFAGQNHIFKPPSGFQQTEEITIGMLPVYVSRNDAGLTEIASVWQPTEEELDLLLKGAVVVLRVLGETMPPVSLDAEYVQLKP